MKNRIEISSDEKNVYANIKVNASNVGIRILTGFIVLEILIFLVLLSQIKSDDVISMLFPILMISIVFIGLPLRYLLWNKYGSEALIVNSKSVSWSYDYGFFRTNRQTVNYHMLATDYEKIRDQDGVEVGKLIFVNYREEDDLPEIIHQTTVLLSKYEIAELEREIGELLSNELFDKNGIVPFSLN